VRDVPGSPLRARLYPSSSGRRGSVSEVGAGLLRPGGSEHGDGSQDGGSGEPVKPFVPRASETVWNRREGRSHRGSFAEGIRGQDLWCWPRSRFGPIRREAGWLPA
jgi:hypothetical protein